MTVTLQPADLPAPDGGPTYRRVPLGTPTVSTPTVTPNVYVNLSAVVGVHSHADADALAAAFYAFLAESGGYLIPTSMAPDGAYTTDAILDQLPDDYLPDIVIADANPDA